MSGPDNRFELLARGAAERIASSRDLAEQLTLLPDQAPAPTDGRPKRGQGKALNQMRDWLASKGYRMPEDVLAEMAGLASGSDAVTTAMATAERILAWAQDGAREGDKLAPKIPSMAKRIEVFGMVFATQLRAADAMLPYGTPKATPDGGPVLVNQVIVAGPAAAAAPQGSDRARDVTPQARRIAPPPMPGKTQQNQGLAAPEVARSDGKDRTE